MTATAKPWFRQVSALVIATACLLACSAVAAQALAPAQRPPYATPDAPLLGAAWYPEQWPQSAWEHDLALMQAAHFTVVRVGEFAWSTLEPSEGQYDFAWLDRAISLAGKHGLKVVIGTPTDAPPAWLTRKYPDTLGVNEDGHTREHGGRRQFSYASPRYRHLCAAIVRHMAQRYGHNPVVLGWQIGNEYTDESFDANTRAQFQSFLKQRYGTLANLNDKWTTAYWSQTYSDWAQIPLATHGNPGLLLEHKHFVTATWQSFQQNQVDVLRPLIDPRQFITTNIGGLAWSDNWDHYVITAPLDLASWDEYVGTGHLDVAKEAMLNDFVRGWKRQNFWIMETQPATVNWSPLNNALSPGETRALAWQAVGHGADAVLYWQWRPALNGQEQYHGSIVGPDGEPLPLYREVQELGAEFLRAREALNGTSPHAEIALLHTYDSRWAIDFQQHTREYDQQAVLMRFYEPLRKEAASIGQSIDIIDPTQPGDLGRYKLLLAPSLNVIDDDLAHKLLDYVRSGGHLLLGPRSGMKDTFNRLQPQRQPGPLADALGAKVEQYYALHDPVKLAPQSGNSHAAKMTTAHPLADIWAEALMPTAKDTSVDFVYRDPGGWLDTQPAMVSRQLGSGTLTYLGTLMDPEQMWRVIHQAMWDAGMPPYSDAPEGIEVCERRNGSRHVLIVINHRIEAGDIDIPLRYRAVLPNARISETYMPTNLPTTHVQLQSQEVVLLIREEQP